MMQSPLGDASRIDVMVIDEIAEWLDETLFCFPAGSWQPVSLACPLVVGQDPYPHNRAPPTRPGG